MRPTYAVRLHRWLITLALMCSATRMSAQGASIAGTVRSDSSDRPIAQAQIEVSDLKLAVRTDSLGNFRLNGIPAGAHQLTIRVIGFEPFKTTMVFAASEQIEVQFLLRDAVTEIAEVSVTAAAKSRFGFRLADFESRRARHLGNFITADVFEKHAGRNLADVIAGNVPGVGTGRKIRHKGADIAPAHGALSSAGDTERNVDVQWPAGPSGI